MRLFVATHNQHKVREMGQILPGMEIVADDPAGVEENAPDFAGNALIKVRAIAARHPGEWCIADDSGLEVNALGGAPGVRSARYAGEPSNTANNNALLLKNLAGVADRRANFTCAIALVDPRGEEHVAVGKCFGRVAEKPSGAEGFGYDPLFVPDGCDRSFAELAAEEKNAISHRGRALEQVKRIFAAAPTAARDRGAVMNGIERLHEIVVKLQNPEKGCPWDRVQTLESLKPCVLEETYELLAAMDKPGDRGNYIEELGDVLLQVMFQCVMAEKTGDFTFDDVANGISDKLVHRHPHVFGDVNATTPEAVMRNWEQIKQLEHRKESRHSALDGVPPTLPALLKAQRSQEKASRVGFDWREASGPMAKIKEEIAELEAEIAKRPSELPKDSDAVKAELGDVLFSICNLARHLKVDAESALELSSAKFSRRFRTVEAAAKAAGRNLKDMTLGEMEELWQAAKREEA